MTTTSEPARHGDKYKALAMTRRDGIFFGLFVTTNSSRRPTDRLSREVAEEMADDLLSQFGTWDNRSVRRRDHVFAGTEVAIPCLWASSSCCHRLRTGRRSGDPDGVSAHRNTFDSEGRSVAGATQAFENLQRGWKQAAAAAGDRFLPP